MLTKRISHVFANFDVTLGAGLEGEGERGMMQLFMNPMSSMHCFSGHVSDKRACANMQTCRKCLDQHKDSTLIARVATPPLLS